MKGPRGLPIVLFAALLTLQPSGDHSRAANNPPQLDPRQGAGSSVALTPDLKTEPMAAGGAAPDAPAVANPLWAIPLRSLNTTRERPIFLPSRRPPTPAVPAAPRVVQQPPAAVVEAETPSLSLVGVVAGESDGFAVFISSTTHAIVRLRTGEGHDGWILRSVKTREAVLEKNRRTIVIGLPTPAGGRQ